MKKNHSPWKTSQSVFITAQFFQLFGKLVPPCQSEHITITITNRASQ